MKKNTSGFTIVEVFVIIVVICMLIIIASVSLLKIQSSSRDNLRKSRLTIIAETLEKYYDTNGEYPSCAAMTAQPASTVTLNTLKGMDPAVLTAPGAVSGTNSIDSSCAGDPQTSTFTYIPADGHFTLKYREEATSAVKSISDRRR